MRHIDNSNIFVKYIDGNEIYFNEKSRKKGLTIKFYNTIQKIKFYNTIQKKLITTKTPN